MKAVGGSLGTLVKMVKGEESYDSAKAKAAVETIAAKAKGFDAMFPAGTEKGGETEAAATIWSDTAGFKAALAKLETTAAAQVAVRVADVGQQQVHRVGALPLAVAGVEQPLDRPVSRLVPTEYRHRNNAGAGCEFFPQ